MLQQNLQQIADVSEEEFAFYADMAAKCPKGFCVKAIANIEKVVSMIDRMAGPVWHGKTIRNTSACREKGNGDEYTVSYMGRASCPECAGCRCAGVEREYGGAAGLS